MRDSVIQKGKTLLITGVLFLSIFLIVISMFVFHFYEKKNYLKWLEQKVSEVDAQATEVNSLKKSIRYVEQLQVANKRFFDALVYVHNKISNETYLTEINYTKERRFQIQGRSDSIASVFDFVEKLKTNPSFNDLETKRMTKRIVDNKEVVDFEIDSVLVPPSTRPAQGAKK